MLGQQRARAVVCRAGQHVPPAPGGNGQRGARPAAAPAQALGQPGGDRDRVPAALERDHVPGRRAVGGQRGVAAGEPVRVVPPQPQRPRGHQQLLGVQADGGRPASCAASSARRLRVVHRPPVVRVHQGEPGQLAALVHVGRARHGELYQLGAQRVHPRRRGDAAGERRDLAGERGVGQRGRGERERAGLVFLVRAAATTWRSSPRASPWSGSRRPARSRSARRRPGSARAGTRCRARAPRPPASASARSCQRVTSAAHSPGDLGEHGQPGPDVLLALGVVGGQRGHGGRPVPGEPRRERVELPGLDAEPVRLAADLVQRGQPGPAVERGVLDALGHHRAAGLLEADHELVPAPAPLPRSAAERERGHGGQGRVQPRRAAGPPPRRPRPSRRRRRRPARARRAPRTPGTRGNAVSSSASTVRRSPAARPRSAGSSGAGQQPGQPPYLGGEAARGHLPLGGLRDLGEALRVPGELRVPRRSAGPPRPDRGTGRRPCRARRSRWCPRTSSPAAVPRSPVRIFSVTTQAPPVASASRSR